MAEREIWRVTDAQVTGLQVECGVCGMWFDLDDVLPGEVGIDPECAFVDCPECGELADLSGVRCDAWLAEGGAI